MSATGLAAFDSAIQEANIWLKTMMKYLETDDRHFAYSALRAGLHALRDRIGPDSAVHLGAQLPTLVRGIYYEGWHMAGTPTKERHKKEFLAHVESALPKGMETDPERICRAVFDTLWERIDPGEVAKLIGLFPMELRDLWPRVAQET